MVIYLLYLINYSIPLKTTCPFPAEAIRILSEVRIRDEFSRYIIPPPILAALAILIKSDTRCFEQSIKKPPPAAAIRIKSDVNISLIYFLEVT